MKINKNILIGFVGSDPNVVNFPNGMKKVTFSVGVEPPYESDEPLWFEVHLWREAAKVAETIIKSGKPIKVKGRLQIESWQDKHTGAARSKPIILGERFKLIGKPKQEENY